MQTKVIFILIVITSLKQTLAISSFNCNNTGTKCVPSGSVVTCTCTVEDMEGIGSTQWDGSAFTGCPITSNEITLLHPSFTLRPQVICDDDAIVATPVSQEGVNYTSDVSIAVNTTTNGSIVRCSLAGRSPPVGMTTLKVGDVPQSVGVPSILPSSLTRGIFSLSWTELTSVFGGVGSYEVLVRADKQGDTTRLCGEMTAPNRNTVPLRQFTGWIAEGQVCYFSVVTVTGDICSFRSSPSQEASITLQGPNQTTVERITLDSPIYIDNHLRRINMSFMYTQEMPVMIIDGLVSETTNFSITYAYSVDRSCTLIVPSTCDQQQWCNYTLTLDDCPTMTSGSGFFSVVPLNIIGRGKSTTSNMIENMNPLFIVMNQTDTNSPGEINLQLSFQISYFGDCYLEYGLGAECVNLNMSKTIAVHGNVAMVNFTLTNNGIYCYQINCNSTIAQGTINYQANGNGGGGGGGGGGSPWWIVFIVIGVVSIIIGVIILCLCVQRPWKNKDNQGGADAEGNKKEKKRETDHKEACINIESSDGPGRQLLQDDKLYVDPSSIEHEQAPTGDEYAMVDMTNRKKAKLTNVAGNQVLYQDPSSIEHEQAPTGDEYAMPQQKGRKNGKHQGSSVDPGSVDVAAMYSTVDTSKKKNQLTYAQLDVGSGSGGKPLPQSTPYATVVT